MSEGGVETWFPADVTIRKVETGERRVYRSHEMEMDGDWSPYIWEEGNFACDCNRALFFATASGEPPPGASCGDGQFVVEQIVHAITGERLWAERSYSDE